MKEDKGKTMNELLKVEQISYQYTDEFLALNKVSVSFQAGERVVILGGNGAGKSTFFLCCNGVLRPQSGKIFYKGQEISKAKKDILMLRKGVGLVFQDPDSQLIAGSVESEVSFGAMNLKLERKEVARRVDEALEQMDISRYRDTAPQYLSGGEKKRVSIADILVMEPELIYFDEPTASLDPENADVFEKTLDELSAKGIAMAISTHDVNFAYKIAERAIVFAQGEIIADGPIDEVFASEDILARANLKKPLLYEAYELLDSEFGLAEAHRTGPYAAAVPRPRSIEAFRMCLKAIKPAIAEP